MAASRPSLVDLNRPLHTFEGQMTFDALVKMHDGWRRARHGPSCIQVQADEQCRITRHGRVRPTIADSS